MLQDVNNTLISKFTERPDGELYDPDELLKREARKKRVQARLGEKKQMPLNEPKIANAYSGDAKFSHLSNFAPRDFVFQDKSYRNVEHAYQTNKSGTFDENVYNKYVRVSDVQYKIAGQKVDKEISIGLMEQIVASMYKQNPEAYQKLLDTKGMTIEHNIPNRQADIWTKEMPRILTALRDDGLDAFVKVTDEVASVIKVDKFWDRAGVAADTEYTYLFGDNTNDRLNTQHIPTKTQAVIRGLPNAIGIDTRYSRTEDFADTDDNFARFQQHVDEQIQKALDIGKPIKVSAGGFATGAGVGLPQRFKEYLDNAINNIGGTPNIKRSGTVYNTIENPKGLNHYVNRTLYNYANSDITFDFTATGGPSGGGNSAGKGTPDFKKKWTNVAVDNAGKLTASNIDEVAQKLADALTSGQTVNIAGHGNYSSTRGGFPKAVFQSQVDGTVQTIFDRAIELAGDKPITGKVISGGQSGFDEAGIRTARNLNIPTEVNVTDYTWRDAGGEHIKDEQGFKNRIDAVNPPKSLGAAVVDDPVFTENQELDPKFVSETANKAGLPKNALNEMFFKHGLKLLPALNIFRTLGIVDEAIELVADKVLKNVPGFKNTSIGKSIANKGIGLMWLKAELANLFAHHQVAAGTSTAILDAQIGNLIWANLTDTELEDLPKDTQELLAQDIGEVYREVFAPGETSAFEQIDLYTLDKTGKRQMDWAIHAGKYGYNHVGDVIGKGWNNMFPKDKDNE